MQRTWTTVGRKYTEGNRRELSEIFDRMEWHDLPYTTGMSQGMGIKETIKQLRIPKVSRVSDSNELAPYGLLGIKAHYANGDATIYLVDEGTGVVPIASDFYPKVKSAEKRTSHRTRTVVRGLKGVRR